MLTPKNYPKTPLYAEIPAQIKILKNNCNFWTNEPIFIKFEIKVHSVKQNHRGYFLRLNNIIQDGGGRHLEFVRSAVTVELFDRFLPNLNAK